MQKRRIILLVGFVAAVAVGFVLFTRNSVPHEPAALSVRHDVHDMGMSQDIDPVKVLEDRFEGVLVYNPFGEFINNLFVFGTKIQAYSVDEGALKAAMHNTYPPFYKPTNREILDMAAWQVGQRWAFDGRLRQYRFFSPAPELPYAFNLADGWSFRKHRGLNNTYSPADFPVGMDVYYFGRFTPAAGADAEKFYDSIRAYYATKVLKVYGAPVIPSVQRDMQIVTLAGYPALYWEPNPPSTFGMRARWRQWSFVAKGQAFLIVSSSDEVHWKKISEDVDRMLDSFAVRD